VNNTNDLAFIYKNNTVENKLSNSIQIQLLGTEKNINGIGTKIESTTADGIKTTTVFNPMKGYLSSHDKTIIIGIGKNLNSNLTITWPDGKKQNIEQVASGKILKVAYKDAGIIEEEVVQKKKLFEDITEKVKLNYIHKENEYIDFKLEPLLPHRFSQLGPCISVGDLNGDKMEDFFVGGPKDHPATLFFQNADSTFNEVKQPAFEKDKQFEDGAVATLDIDKDGDKDLIVTTGGNEYPKQNSKYPIRIYLNDGKGNFTISKFSGRFFTSSNTIAIADMDKDGNPEIFVGGRVVPGHYGLIPESYLFTVQADSLVDISKETGISKIGMVTSAVWSDLNKDGWPDLAMAGEWMPISIFYNINGKLRNTPVTMENSNGWWNKLVSHDIDKDGDIDLVAGNNGLNSRYRGNKDRPVTMLVSDFDNNGSTDCMISLFERNKSYPVGLRDNVLDQMPFLRKKFLRYISYSTATIEDIFSTEQLLKASKFYADNMVSSIFRNEGNGKFTEQYLPAEAQFFPVNSIQFLDVNKDGFDDILLAGNDYSTEVETGRNDAGIGLVLLGKENQTYTSMSVSESNFYVPDDVKCMEKIRIGSKISLLVGKNRSTLQVIGHSK